MEYYSWKRIFFPTFKFAISNKNFNNSTLSLSNFFRAKQWKFLARWRWTYVITIVAMLSHRKSKSSMDRFFEDGFSKISGEIIISGHNLYNLSSETIRTFFHNVVSSEWAPGCFSSPTSAHRDVCTSSSFNRVWPTYPPDSSVSSVYSHVLAAKYIGISIIRLV